MGVLSDTIAFPLSTMPILGYDLVSDYNAMLVLPAFLVLVLMTTYSYTVLQNYYSERLKAKDAEPPQVPYLVPFLGNTYAFVSSPADFLAKIWKTFQGAPTRVLLGGKKMYIIPHGEHVTALFKSSRYLNAEFTTIVAFQDVLGLPGKELQQLYADQSGIDPKPAPGYEHMEDKHRPFFQIHKQVHAYFNGSSMEAITAKYVEKLSARIVSLRAPSLHDSAWMHQLDLYGFFRNEIFHAATEAICGDHIFRLCPEFCKDFWDFDEHLPDLISGKPNFMNRRALAARATMVRDVQTWQQHAKETFDWNDPELSTAGWEPVYGARIMRARQQMFKGLGNSNEANASYDLGLIWASNANVIPTLFWCLLFILQTPSCKEDILKEIDPCFRPDSLEFDLKELLKSPLLQSVYLETLRLSQAAAITRIPREPRYRIGKWAIKKGDMMFATTWVASRDTSFWNQGSTDSGTGMLEHPIDKFWAERFLVFENDSASGPIRKADTGTPTTARNQNDVKSRNLNRFSTARVDTSGMQGYFFPYGGGAKMCPGRFYAKEQIIVTVALVLRSFDLELLDLSNSSRLQPEMPFTPLGTVRPTSRVPFNIRNRKLD